MTRPPPAGVQAAIEAHEGKRFMWTGAVFWPLDADGTPEPPAPGFEEILAEHYASALRIAGRLN